MSGSSETGRLPGRGRASGDPEWAIRAREVLMKRYKASESHPVILFKKICCLHRQREEIWAEDAKKHTRMTSMGDFVFCSNNRSTCLTMAIFPPFLCGFLFVFLRRSLVRLGYPALQLLIKNTLLCKCCRDKIRAKVCICLSHDWVWADCRPLGEEVG